MPWELRTKKKEISFHTYHFHPALFLPTQEMAGRHILFKQEMAGRHILLRRVCVRAARMKSMHFD
jgi:hypothetical protein